MSIRQFMERNYRHFNARETLEAAKAWNTLLDQDGKMLLALGGAMSTAELGVTLAEMIRQDKVHAISCTGANLEEDIFNLTAHDDYCVVPHWRELTPEQELELRDEGFNRVTDTCIPETVLRHIESHMLEFWTEAADKGESYFPYEYFYRLIREGRIDDHCQVPKEDSWVWAACEKNLPIVSPGWEDSTLGNIFAARVIDGRVKSHSAMKSGTQQMQMLAEWYVENMDPAGIGFFQIAGGISGDFPICAVPMLIQDLKKDVRLWAYFAQITDSQVSYGSYSGANPSEKITWYKLPTDAPKFAINSDASIVAPLIFSYVLDL